MSGAARRGLPRPHRLARAAVVTIAFLLLGAAAAGHDLAEADRLRGSGRLGAAETAYRGFVAADPGDAPARARLAGLLLQSHRYREAAAEFAVLLAALPEGPARAAARRGLGAARLGAGETRRAVRVLREALRRRPDDAAAAARLAMALEAASRAAEAGRAWEAFLALEPGHAEATARRERVADRVQALAEARADARRHPGDPRAARVLAWRLEELGDMRGAARALERARETGGDASDERRRAVLLARAGEPERARRILRDAAARAPGVAATLYALAALEAAAGDRRAEAEAWRAALAATPDDRFAAAGLFRALRLAGILDAEIVARQEAVGAGRDVVSLLQLSQALGEAGRGEAAAASLLRAIVAAPNDPLPQAALRDLLRDPPAGTPRDLTTLLAQGAGAAPRVPRAVLHLVAGEADAAAAELEPHLSQAPDDTGGRQLLAWARRLRGEADASFDLLTALRRDAPDDPFVALDLAAALLSRGEARAALEEARAASERLPRRATATAVLAAALVAAGRPADALVEVERGLARHPADPEGELRPVGLRALAALRDEERARRLLSPSTLVEPERLVAMAAARASSMFLGAGGTPPGPALWRARLEGRVRDEVDAHAAIGEILCSFDDPYTRLRPPEETLARFRPVREAEVRLDPLGQVAPGSPTVVARPLPNGGVYLRLTTLLDPVAAEEIEGALAAAPGAEEVVLDLRGNPGGYEDVADEIAASLVPGAHPPERRSRAGPGMRRSSPPESRSPRRVKVLVDGATTSAAERLAEQLARSRDAEVLGGPTAGKEAAQYPFVLPDGWTVLVTTAWGDAERPGV